MRRTFIAATSILFLAACASGGGSRWVRADGSPESDAVREQRAKDLADCATMVGAPTEGTQSTMSLSRGEAEDCMYAKGWRKAD